MQPVKDARDLARKIGTMPPGASVKLDVIHDGSAKTLTLTLGTLPAQQEAANTSSHEDNSGSEVPKIGLTLAPSSKVSGAGSDGVVVTAVEQGGVAADHGFQVGDVILDVGGKPVTTPADVRKGLSDAKTSGKHTVLFRVKSTDGTKFVALPLGDA